MTSNNINKKSIRNYRSQESGGLLFYGYINDNPTGKDEIDTNLQKKRVDYVVSYPFDVRPLPRRRNF